MKQALYTKFGGLDTSLDPVDASQVSFLKCDNFIPTIRRLALRKRGGTKKLTQTGDTYGIRGYEKKTGSASLPVIDIPIRHRRSAGTSFIEKYDWDTETWGVITPGTSTSFAASAVWTTAQIDDLCAIAAGRPAMIKDITSGSVLRLGGPAPTAAPTLSSAAGALTGTFYYVYTFYDSTSGWESSPSPISLAATVTTDDITVGSLQINCAREGVDKKRIYRTIATGEQPFLKVAEVTLATTSYVDAILDANLTATAPIINDHDPPPDPSYIVAAHENRIWIASGANLYFSKAYDGSYPTLEYFSTARMFTAPHIITGLLPIRTGGMLVFCPPGFGTQELQGRTVSDSDDGFSLVNRDPYDGTNYSTSISSNGEEYAYWGVQGPTVKSFAGQNTNIDKHIHNAIRDMLLAVYNTTTFVWSQWHQGYKQFIFGVSATNTTGSLVVEYGTSLVVPLYDVVSGDTVEVNEV